MRSLWCEHLPAGVEPRLAMRRPSLPSAPRLRRRPLPLWPRRRDTVPGCAASASRPRPSHDCDVRPRILFYFVELSSGIAGQCKDDSISLSVWSRGVAPYAQEGVERHLGLSASDVFARTAPAREVPRPPRPACLPVGGSTCAVHGPACANWRSDMLKERDIRGATRLRISWDGTWHSSSGPAVASAPSAPPWVSEDGSYGEAE